MKRIGIPAIIFMLLFTLVSERTPANAATNSVVIDSKTINIRSGPGLSYEVTDSLKRGDKVDVLSTSDEWLQVQFGSSKGWIASWLTASGDEATATSTIVSQVDGLNIRSAPSIGAAVLGRLDAGDEAVMIGTEGSWVKIAYNNANGWVHTDYISSIANKDVSNSTSAKKESGTFTVAVDALNVRKKASLSSKKIETINKDETYTVNEVDGNWVQISLDKGKEGWVYSFHGTVSAKSSSKKESSTNSKSVTILTDGTNLRQKATTSSPIVLRANAGQQFAIQSQTDDWYEILLPGGETAFVADWVVSAEDSVVNQKTVKKTPAEKKKARVPGTLKGLTIVLDPGHGGNDHGTIGVRGTDEKHITLLTAELLATKLQAAGATVKLTRETDKYVTLPKRVGTSDQHNADAFISIHYDATLDSSVTGFTTYYTYSAHKELADAVHTGLDSTIRLRDRGVQPGNYFVLRENKSSAILIELGFLSNASEERFIKTDNFREQAAHGIYNGLLNYFNEK